MAACVSESLDSNGDVASAGGIFVCSVVTGGCLKIAGLSCCVAAHWCIAFLAACLSKSLDSSGGLAAAGGDLLCFVVAVVG